MAWNQVARPLAESLPRNYEAKGLEHWQREYEKARERQRTAECVLVMQRASRRMNLCEIAVMNIKDGIRGGWIAA